MIENEDDNKKSEMQTDAIYINYDTVSEKGGDIGGVLFIQFTLCIIILLLIFILNIINKEMIAGITECFGVYSSSKTEKIYVDAAMAVISYLHD